MHDLGTINRLNDLAVVEADLKRIVAGRLATKANVLNIYVYNDLAKNALAAVQAKHPGVDLHKLGLTTEDVAIALELEDAYEHQLLLKYTGVELLDMLIELEREAAAHQQEQVDVDYYALRGEDV